MFNICIFRLKINGNASCELSRNILKTKRKSGAKMKTSAYADVMSGLVGHHHDVESLHLVGSIRPQSASSSTVTPSALPSLGSSTTLPSTALPPPAQSSSSSSSASSTPAKKRKMSSSKSHEVLMFLKDFSERQELKEAEKLEKLDKMH